jgi:hypothetical protein
MLEAVTDAYRRSEKIVGVPVIARRLVALGADWMLKTGKIEHGLLEIGRLGEMSKVTDSRALMILAEYADNVYRSSPRLFSNRCSEKAALVRCLELKLERQLDRTRAADLIERVEARPVTSGQAAGQRLRRLAEECVGQAVVGGAEVWVVEEVEELAPESEPHIVDQVKFPLKCDIRLPRSETPQHIAPEVALLAGVRRCERSWIERPGRTLAKV